jgi:chromosome segregation ATPase
LESQRDDEQSETLEYLERIDGLHAKIAYLSSQLSENAAAEASKAPDSSPEKKIAEQNEKIAQLLQEGEKLSRNEVRHREALKKLRSRLQEEEKKSVELRARLEKAEADVRDLREFGRVADAKEKALNDKISSLLVSQRSLDATISERDSLSEEVRDLGKRLDDSEQRAHEADKKGLSSKVEEQKGIIANLEEELANSRIEKRLVEDRVKSEMNEIKQLYNKELEKCRLTEKDLKSEVQVRSPK